MAFSRVTGSTVGLIVALNLLLGLFMTTNVLAQPCNKEDKAKAQALIKQGTRFLRGRKASLAVAAFKQAYRHCKARAIQFNLALAYRVLGNRVVAATHLRRYLAGANPGERKALPPPLQQLLLEVGVLKVQIRLAKATVWVDGRLAGSGRVEVVVLPGIRAVEIRLGERVLMHKKLDVSGGQTVVWSPHIVVRPRPPPPKPSPPTPVKQRGIHWGYFAAATIVAVSAGGLLIYTGLRTRDLEREYHDAPSVNLCSKGVFYMNTTNALIGIASATAIGAVLLAIYTRWRGRTLPEKAVILPGVTARGAAITLRWQY